MLCLTKVIYFNSLKIGRRSNDLRTERDNFAFMWKRSTPILFTVQALVLLAAISFCAGAQQNWQADETTTPELVLLVAAANGDTAVLRTVLASGVDPEIFSSAGITPLAYAVSNRQTAAAKMLLDSGADPDNTTYFGQTPLILAIKNGDLPMAELLIRAGASVSKPDANGASPLHYAALFGLYYEADMLIYYEAIADLKSLDGTTPLMAAVMSGSYDIADILIRNGANVNSTDDIGYTPLLLAAQNGDTLTAELLILSGADIYKAASDGHNAASIAIRDGHTEFLEYIFSKGRLWTETQSVNLWNVADQYRRKEMLTLLTETKIPRPPSSSFNSISAELAWVQTTRQSFASVTLKSRRNISGTGISAGFWHKPFPSRIIIEGEDDILYQYRDRRSVIHAGVFKEFTLGRTASGMLWITSLTARAGYRFGNTYPGTDLKPESGMIFIPSVALQLETPFLTWSVAAEYMKTEVYRSGPVWVKTGVAFNYYPVNVKSKGKSIRWY